MKDYDGALYVWELVETPDGVYAIAAALTTPGRYATMLNS